MKSTEINRLCKYVSLTVIGQARDRFPESEEERLLTTLPPLCGLSALAALQCKMWSLKSQKKTAVKLSDLLLDSPPRGVYLVYQPTHCVCIDTIAGQVRDLAASGDLPLNDRTLREECGFDLSGSFEIRQVLFGKHRNSHYG